MARPRRKAPSLARRTARLEPKRRFFIFCEGKNTEPDYFEALKRKLTGALIEIEFVGVGGVPKTVTNRAIEKAKSLGVGKRRMRGRNSFEECDKVWAVFDRDSHEAYDDSIQKCESAGVGVGRSNPCFELWLILHIEEYDKPDGRNNVQKHLRKICPGYDPDEGKKADCEALLTSLKEAEKRAESQFRRREQEQNGRQLHPPYTTVWKLTREIGAAALQYRRPA